MKKKLPIPPSNHTYYDNAETCRNRLFDNFNPDAPQNEDYHLSTYPNKPLKNKKNKKEQ